ncbi:hypothetical protein TYRP_001392 [Tyrophagus putrescentiae]|nr:hypothetical protein TYRP_001392 [Tyrophagus putrescentiae]
MKKKKRQQLQIEGPNQSEPNSTGDGGGGGGADDSVRQDPRQAPSNIVRQNLARLRRQDTIR